MKNTAFSLISFTRRLIVLTCFACASQSGNAQSITWAFVNATGFDEGPDCRLRWTIGEPMTTEVSGEYGTLRMGFLPFAFADDQVSATMDVNEDITITVTPNPASEEIRINVPGDEQYAIRILSIDGKPMIANDINDALTMDIRSFPDGIYVLYVLATNGTYNSTTFIKS